MCNWLLASYWAACGNEHSSTGSKADRCSRYLSFPLRLRSLLSVIPPCLSLSVSVYPLNLANLIILYSMMTINGADHRLYWNRWWLSSLWSTPFVSLWDSDLNFNLTQNVLLCISGFGAISIMPFGPWQELTALCMIVDFLLISIGTTLINGRWCRLWSFEKPSCLPALVY